MLPVKEKCMNISLDIKLCLELKTNNLPPMHCL
jgi:hypothetical protein